MASGLLRNVVRNTCVLGRANSTCNTCHCIRIATWQYTAANRAREFPEPNCGIMGAARSELPRPILAK